MSAGGEAGAADRPPIPGRSGLRTRLMGVVNVTPDSFHDGGRFFDRRRAVDRGLALADEGADLLDVGGESTRPGAAGVTAAEEMDRVLDVISALAGRTDVPVSIDTTKSEVAARALEAGAAVINDVSGGAFDPRILEVAAAGATLVVLGHTPAAPAEMQRRTAYGDVVAEVAAALARAAQAARAAGVPAERIAVDPGIGFGKTAEQSARLIGRLDAFAALGYFVVVGASRKSFIGRILDANRPGTGGATEDRLAGSLGAALAAAAGGAHIVRVHDVRATREALAVFEAIRAEAPARERP